VLVSSLSSRRLKCSFHNINDWRYASFKVGQIYNNFFVFQIGLSTFRLRFFLPLKKNK